MTRSQQTIEDLNKSFNSWYVHSRAIRTVMYHIYPR